ncbi:hypothetical protein Salat_2137400 [Sesamum alatum]|uniref:Uncharacterized protein n=1 Tax=Sesamum alatum TaxID=300844 RepID=A0AAE1Y182_9LAMI|nr:hypothetical protein Salat_2137400 [Sesamum alatum]
MLFGSWLRAPPPANVRGQTMNSGWRGSPMQSRQPNFHSRLASPSPVPNYPSRRGHSVFGDFTPQACPTTSDHPPQPCLSTNYMPPQPLYPPLTDLNIPAIYLDDPVLSKSVQTTTISQ